MYQKSPQSWTKHLDFIIIDLLSLYAAFVLSYYLRHGSLDFRALDLYRSTFVVLGLLQVLVSIFFQSFKNVLKRGYYREFAETVKHISKFTLLSVLLLYLSHQGGDFSRAVMLMTCGNYLIFSYITRILWKRFLIKRYNMKDDRSMLIVTRSSAAESIIESLKKNGFEIFNITGLVLLDRNLTGSQIKGIPVVAGSEDVVEYVCREWVDEVFISIPQGESYPHKLIDQFREMGVVVHLELAKQNYLEGEKRFVERIGEYTVLTTTMNLATPLQLFIKRSMDIAGGLAGSLVALILTVILGPLIYIQSPGPIFFSQVRVGKNGKKFKMYKFRSMYMDAEERKQELMAQNRVKDGMMFKLDWDPRIIGNKILPDGTKKTGIGEFIRAMSLDEWPQFLNVLKGDMSLVGTRPPTVDEWEKYDLHHRVRLAAKPGITGMWQISGRSNITDFEEVVKLDSKYIRNWNIGLDFRILLKTVLVVLKRDGSM